MPMHAKKALKESKNLVGPIEIIHDEAKGRAFDNLTKAINLLENEGWEFLDYSTHYDSKLGQNVGYAVMRKRS